MESNFCDFQIVEERIVEIPPCWPAILISTFAGIGITLISLSNIPIGKKLFGIIILLLWSIIWIIIIQINWKNKNYNQNWYLSIMPTIFIVFFTTFIIMIDSYPGLD